MKRERGLVEVLRPHLERRGKRGGQAKLKVEDQLLVALEYWRSLLAPVSHWGKLGIARNDRRADCTKERRFASQVQQVAATQPAAVVPTRLGIESDAGRCGRN